MKRKLTIPLLITALLLLAVITAFFAGSPRTAAAQDMPTTTPAPLVTPVVSAGTNLGSTGAMNCPMMSGNMTGVGTGMMPGMGTMQNPGANMGNMSGTMGMNMSGMGNMSNMTNMSDRYFIFSDPTTWFNGNPWILIGWIVLFMVLLTILAAFGLGVFYFARRIAQNHPAPKA